MKLLGFKERMIGWLMLYVALGFIPLAFTEALIHPFLLTPAAEVEKYNYARNIVDCIKPAILLHVLYASFLYLGQVNIDPTVNNWIKKSTQDVGKVVLALIAYHGKELLDYLAYENAVPECFNPAAFLFLWELLPVFLLLLWAIITANKPTRDAG